MDIAEELCKVVVNNHINEQNPVLNISDKTCLTINSIFKPNGETISRCDVKSMWFQSGDLWGIVDYEEQKGVKINMSKDYEIDWVRLLDNLCDLFIETEDENEKEYIKNKGLNLLKAILERHPEWKGKTVEEI